MSNPPTPAETRAAYLDALRRVAECRRIWLGLEVSVPESQDRSIAFHLEKTCGRNSSNFEPNC